MDKTNFPALNLPPCDLRLRADAQGRTEVYDEYRARWVVLTPEENVRQHFVHYLESALGYSRYRLVLERGLRFNGTPRRVDALVYDDAARPLVVVEFKAPGVAVTQRTFDQIVRYNLVLKAPYLMVSNGLKHYCVHVDLSSGSYEFLKSLPAYAEIKGGG